MLLVNQILHNRYRIMRQLGQGGMGAVYEAHDNVFDTTCAVKEIIIDLAKSANPKQQEMILLAFEREAKLLAKIKHEVVPHVRDYFTEDNRQYLIMELVEGKDLGELLEERKSPFPLDDVVRWTDQLLDGLDYLHTQNPPIFHRDLKPQNLKLTPRGRIKLLDFGIAKGGAEKPNSSTVNNQTFVAATLNYSPIEQVFRVLDPVFREVLMQRYEGRVQAVMQQNADARSDLYALGATVYHLLTGALPIDALKRTIEVWSGKKDPLENPSALNNRIPPEISNVLLRAMDLDHGRRYLSALEMQQALQQAAAAVRARETGQAAGFSAAFNSDSERLRQLEIQRQQQTRLGGEPSGFSNEATQEMSAEQLRSSLQPPISEQTIQAGAVGYPPNFGAGEPPPPTPNTPFNTGGSPAYNTGGGPQPTEMAALGAIPTGANVPPPNFPNNQFSTGGAQNSANPLNPNPAFAVNYAGQPPRRTSKVWWILPILLLMFFGVAAAGGGLYLWYQKNNGPVAGPDSTPTATPAATASASPSASPTASVSPSPAASPSASPTGVKGETPKPTAEPTAPKLAPNNPVQPRTPAPQPKTPAPKPKKDRNSDCIFTGDC